MDRPRPLYPYLKTAVALGIGLLPASAGAQTAAGLLAAQLDSAALALGQTTTERTAEGTSSGPDVTVIYLTDVSHYTTGGPVNGMRAYALGTTSCNVGDEPVAWCDDTGCGGGLGDEDHPAIAQNLYRLKDGRFDQIGMSWLKHGFVSTNSPDPNCGSCQQPPLGGDQLGVGCTDTYGSSLNGSRPLGMRSEVNATTGLFPFPYTIVSSPLSIDQRIQVLQDDLDPALNLGALYYMEGQYVTGDDALEGNALNNASYRLATVNASYSINLSGSTVRERSALYAWQANDPGVEIANADVAGVGGPVQRFEAARRVTAAPGGGYHYEIAVHNLNSDRSARGLLVEFPEAAVITEVGFHDVDHHSGEPYTTTDWTSAVADGGSSVHWFTDDFGTDPNANALRWGTTFSFRFDADRPPDGALFSLELFKPGTPTTVAIPFAGPTVFADGFESGDTSAWDEATN